MPKNNNTNTAAFLEAVQLGISDATIRNWEKLNTKTAGRLMTRANKRNSKKRVLPIEYINNPNNIPFVLGILDYVDENEVGIMNAIYSLGINMLRRDGLLDKHHVIEALCEYSDVLVNDELTLIALPNDEFDILGLIYQSFLQEGKKNVIGSYYTPHSVAYNMTKEFDFSNGELFFDPCCGSGAFLLTAAVKEPQQLFGIDNDRIAVLISKINLLLKYKTFEFTPQIYCLDYLMGHSVIQQHPIFDKTFDYIATNPPWGAMDDLHLNIPFVTSKETFSYFFVKAYDQLKESGIIRFLFPASILNVKVHKDVRKYILDKAGLISITTYDDMFSGVTTKYVDIQCGFGAQEDRFIVYSGKDIHTVQISTVYETENLIFNLLDDIDLHIIRICKDRGCFSLQNSVWALGIVTGDNKGKLSQRCLPGMEKIYTGKEIQPYVLRPAQNYIRYNRNELQQVAKEDIYRAPEKLVYKFISNKLVFAYDNSSSLFLNSANILIPTIPFMSMKTVMAFLNSAVFQFMYIKLFGEVKILKGNLIELLFPEISETQNEQISMLVDSVLGGDNTKIEAIEKCIFAIYGLTEEEIKYVRRIVYGKAD